MKVLNNVQPIRSGGTPPAQAPSSNSGLSPYWSSPESPCRSSDPGGSGSFPSMWGSSLFPSAKKDFFFFLKKKSTFWGLIQCLLVAGSPQGSALILRGSEGMSVRQQSLPELRLAVGVRVRAAHPAGQLHRLVEGVVLRRRTRQRVSRSAGCETKTHGRENVTSTTSTVAKA